ARAMLQRHLSRYAAEFQVKMTNERSMPSPEGSGPRLHAKLSASKAIWGTDERLQPIVRDAAQRGIIGSFDGDVGWRLRNGDGVRLQRKLDLGKHRGVLRLDRHEYPGPAAQVDPRGVVEH